MHCSDEQLLAHLDGELSVFGSHRVRRHLKSCWHCRTRLGACEQEIQGLTVAMDEWPFPGPEWNRVARQRLNWRLQEFEAGFEGSPRRGIRPFTVPIAVAAAAILCFSGWFAWTGRIHPRLRAADVIAEVSQAERTLYLQPVQQTFSVEIAEIRPARRIVTAKLQIWSDREGGKFASRLSGPGGTLEHALWRPSADAEFVYHRAMSAQVVKQRPHREEAVALESLADYGLDSAQLEDAFLHWLESRSWNPVSFAADISLWTAADGSVAAAERMRGADGTPMIRITAQRKSRKMVAVLAVEVDSRNYRPRLQTIRFETAERAIEFRLSATGIQPIRRTEMDSGVFRPDPAIAREVRTFRPVQAGHEEPADPSTKEPPAEAVAIDPREVEARFVLHKAGACLGESVRLSEEAGGTRVVRLDSENASYRSELSLEYMLTALADLRRGQPARGDTAGTRTVALRHAWAIRRIAEDFPARRIAGLPADSWPMLDTMLRDHTSAVRRELGSPELHVPVSSTSENAKIGWRASTPMLVEALTHLNEPVSEDSAATVNRRLDEILNGFSAESSRREAAVK